MVWTTQQTVAADAGARCGPRVLKARLHDVEHRHLPPMLRRTVLAGPDLDAGIYVDVVPVGGSGRPAA